LLGGEAAQLVRVLVERGVDVVPRGEPAEHEVVQRRQQLQRVVPANLAAGDRIDACVVRQRAAEGRIER